MRIAVIPARGGSKRIPRKNVNLFCGKPMIAWSIETAVASGLFDEVVVSTDDSEIAEMARRYGASVPFVRPPALSGDHIGTTPVIAHAIEWFLARGYNLDFVCCIYATAPFLTSGALKQAMQLLADSGADFAFSVTSYAFPIQRAIRLDQDGRVEMIQPENFNIRSQDVEEAFHDAGQFYWGRTTAWLAGKIIFGRHSVGVKIPRYRVQDIDTAEDWRQAEYLFRAIKLAIVD